MMSFLYTFKDSVAIGVGVNLEDLSTYLKINSEDEISPFNNNFGTNFNIIFI